MNPILTSDMRAVVESAHLCFAATVTPEQRPNVSPKGTIRVWDDRSLFFCDIASPQTRANLAANPWIEINVVEHLSRRGYRFRGQATLHRGDAVYEAATERIFREEGKPFTVESIVLVAVEEAEPLISPGYLHASDEGAMRASWRQRRERLDREFEAYLQEAGLFRPRGR